MPTMRMVLNEIYGKPGITPMELSKRIADFPVWSAMEVLKLLQDCTIITLKGTAVIPIYPDASTCVQALRRNAGIEPDLEIK
jgi:hypothetical protein